MEERRQHLRLSKSFSITYQPQTQLMRPTCQSKNISLSGISLGVYHRLQPGSIIKIWIELKDYKKPIIATGQVIWLKDIPDPAFPYQVGIKFTKIDSSEKQVLLNQIKIICKEDNIPFVDVI